MQEIAGIPRLEGDLRLTVTLNAEDAARLAQAVGLVNEGRHAERKREMRASGDFNGFLLRIHV
jgi:hypothetical protein